MTPADPPDPDRVDADDEDRADRSRDDGADDVSADRAPMRAAIYSVLGCGLCFAVAGAAFFGLRAGFSVLVGALMATANLWVFAQVGDAFMSRRGNTASWGLIAVLKLVVLFGGVAAILQSGAVSGLGLAAGYGALPFGVTLASLFGPRPRDDEDGGAGSPGEARPKRPQRDRNVVRRGRNE